MKTIKFNLFIAEEKFSSLQELGKKRTKNSYNLSHSTLIKHI